MKWGVPVDRDGIAMGYPPEWSPVEADLSRRTSGFGRIEMGVRRRPVDERWSSRVQARRDKNLRHPRSRPGRNQFDCPTSRTQSQLANRIRMMSNLVPARRNPAALRDGRATRIPGSGRNPGFYLGDYSMKMFSVSMGCSRCARASSSRAISTWRKTSGLVRTASLTRAIADRDSSICSP